MGWAAVFQGPILGTLAMKLEYSVSWRGHQSFTVQIETHLEQPNRVVACFCEMEMKNPEETHVGEYKKFHTDSNLICTYAK